jgi:hypothetical protein
MGILYFGGKSPQENLAAQTDKKEKGFKWKIYFSKN